MHPLISAGMAKVIDFDDLCIKSRGRAWMDFGVEFEGSFTRKEKAELKSILIYSAICIIFDEMGPCFESKVFVRSPKLIAPEGSFPSLLWSFVSKHLNIIEHNGSEFGDYLDGVNMPGREQDDFSAFFRTAGKTTKKIRKSLERNRIFLDAKEKFKLKISIG